MQRDLARRNMMKEIPTATAVIVNPTHYAVAIRYSMDASAGAESGREGQELPRGPAHPQTRSSKPGVPIVENPPLARALYASVDVGQEIPTPSLSRGGGDSGVHLQIDERQAAGLARLLAIRHELPPERVQWDSAGPFKDSDRIVALFQRRAQPLHDVFSLGGLNPK